MKCEVPAFRSCNTSVFRSWAVALLPAQSPVTAIGGHGVEKGVYELSFKGNVELVVMDTSCSKWGEVLRMFWKRPLVCKWEGGSPEAPQKEM